MSSISLLRRYGSVGAAWPAAGFEHIIGVRPAAIVGASGSCQQGYTPASGFEHIIGFRPSAIVGASGACQHGYSDGC